MSENASNDTQNSASSAFTRVKNHYEALRSELGNKQRSSEYTIAEYGSCGNVVPNITTTDEEQKPVWSQANYTFLENEYNVEDNEHLCVHPNLWENGASNHLSGVFEVLPGKIYQVRGYDMSNLTFVRSNPSGGAPRWFVMDTLMSNECTDAAMKLFEKYLQNDLLKSTSYSLNGSIVGMIISHSHIDHYGGMETVQKYFIKDNGNGQKKDDKKVNNCFILAPAGFYDHAVSENVYLGNAMGRRASYQYGSFIKPSDPNDVHGEISIGIGQGQSTGRPSAVGRATIEIDKNTTLTLDEIDVEFQLTPGTEAPAEMNNYIPRYNALWLAENCSGTLHNLYTLRGAEIRDAKAWSKYLMETAVKYGSNAKVVFQSHNWPHWDSEKKSVRDYIIETAAIYKYIHDQTLLYMNMGYKMNEVADMLVLPRAMQKKWTLKPFYGTPIHNAKAVYQKYLGWYDANPIHLQELPPEQLAKETLRYMMAGNKDNMKKMIADDIAIGNYWTAAYMANQMILSGECENEAKDIRELCATALQQLGYQSESGTWRNAYLSAAFELRNGKLQPDQSKSDQLDQMPPETLLDYISIFFDGERAAAKVNCDAILKVKANANTDNKDTYFAFVVKNGAILYYENPTDDYKNGKETIEISFENLKKVATGSYKVDKHNVLCDISNAEVLVANNKRFKYFDIIGRHDSEVQVKVTDKETNEEKTDTIDLRTEVCKCIKLLEKYTGNKPDSTTVHHLQNNDPLEWEKYYDYLKIQTNTILDGDFFVPGNSGQGIGTDGTFMDFELYYTLYSLYRYLYRSYLKNDYGYKKCLFDENTFVKLKQSINLLETYVADYYLCNSGTYISLDDGDSNAWRYLHDEAESNTRVTFSADAFFFQLYKHYKALSNEVNYVRKYLTRIP